MMHLQLSLQEQQLVDHYRGRVLARMRDSHVLANYARSREFPEHNNQDHLRQAVKHGCRFRVEGPSQSLGPPDNASDTGHSSDVERNSCQAISAIRKRICARGLTAPNARQLSTANAVAVYFATQKHPVEHIPASTTKVSSQVDAAEQRGGCSADPPSSFRLSRTAAEWDGATVSGTSGAEAATAAPLQRHAAANTVHNEAGKEPAVGDGFELDTSRKRSRRRSSSSSSKWRRKKLVLIRSIKHSGGQTQLAFTAAPRKKDLLHVKNKVSTCDTSTSNTTAQQQPYDQARLTMTTAADLTQLNSESKACSSASLSPCLSKRSSEICEKKEASGPPSFSSLAYQPNVRTAAVAHLPGDSLYSRAATRPQSTQQRSGITLEDRDTDAVTKTPKESEPCAPATGDEHEVTCKSVTHNQARKEHSPASQNESSASTYTEVAASGEVKIFADGCGTSSIASLLDALRYSKSAKQSQVEMLEGDKREQRSRLFHVFRKATKKQSNWALGCSESPPRM